MMNSKERVLAVYNDEKRSLLDKVPSHVQYIAPEFISRYEDYFINRYNHTHFNEYFGAPYSLGFDSVFAPIPSSVKFKRMEITTEKGEQVRIGIDGQSVVSKTEYYEGGYVISLEILNQMREQLTIVDKTKEIKAVLEGYKRIESHIYAIVMINGIFDRAWQAMGMTEFSKHFRKKTELYREVIQFYADILISNVEALINASDAQERVVTILDDVAYKGRPMISPAQWEHDFFPYYRDVNKKLSEAGMISQLHTDGDPTDLISIFQRAGFQGLQGWEGGADPFLINERYHDFVVLGFGDVSHILPFGTQSQICAHVEELMLALKENRHFIIGPSTIIYERIPLQNVKIFMDAISQYGRYY
ncbi:MAG: Methylcobalamin:coenzyme M methyltransferase (modular protein) [Promethearchaeota archaeon]|nr:MAG: Methylcobalamin:coenzyme M methyltransferase (modular protein) [Candidatus Lokiarchaeota archaeon]